MARMQALVLMIALVIVLSLALSACNFRNRGLVINEVMASNDNAWHDEWGEDEDYIEVANTAGRAIRLGDYVITDASGKRARLPEVELRPGQVYMLIADGAPEQGPQHLPFRLSSTGDVLVLGDAHGFAVERLELPALAINATLQRFPSGQGELEICEHASPGEINGASCAVNKARAAKRDEARAD
jgi:hypothetical protein